MKPCEKRKQGGQSVWGIKLGFARTCTLQHMRISVYYNLIQNQFDLAAHGQPNFYSVHGRHLKYLFITLEIKMDINVEIDINYVRYFWRFLNFLPPLVRFRRVLVTPLINNVRNHRPP